MKNMTTSYNRTKIEDSDTESNAAYETVNYALDFGSRDINEVVMPTLFPKIFEKVAKASANTKSQQDFQTILKATNILIETHLESSIFPTVCQKESLQCTRNQASVGKALNPEHEILVQQSRIIDEDTNLPLKYKPVENHNSKSTSPYPPISVKIHSLLCQSRTTLREIGTIILVILVCLAVFTGVAYVTCYLVEWAENHGYNLILKCFMDDDYIKSLNSHNVESFEQYNEMIAKRKHNAPISVKINLPSFADWPVGIIIPASPMVVELFVSGVLHIRKILNLINATKNLRKLSLDNVDNKLCAESQLPVPIWNIEPGISTMLSLEFDNFNNKACNKVFKTLESSLKVERLEHFRFKNGEISQDNGYAIESLLLNNKRTLKQIQFTKCTSNVTLFKTKPEIVFPQVVNLVLDVSTENQNGLFGSLEKLGVMFPNLEHLQLGNQWRALKEIESLQNLKQLKDLRVSIAAPEGQTNFNVAFIGLYFPNLTSAEIVVKFKRCEKSPEANTIEGYKEIPDGLKANVRIKSNCNLQCVS